MPIRDPSESEKDKNPTQIIMDWWRNKENGLTMIDLWKALEAIGKKHALKK